LPDAERGIEFYTDYPPSKNTAPGLGGYLISLLPQGLLILALSQQRGMEKVDEQKVLKGL
jgi:hypothetical protein